MGRRSFPHLSRHSTVLSERFWHGRSERGRIKHSFLAHLQARRADEPPQPKGCPLLYVVSSSVCFSSPSIEPSSILISGLRVHLHRDLMVPDCGSSSRPCLKRPPHRVRSPSN